MTLLRGGGGIAMQKKLFGAMRAKLAVQSAMSQVQRTGTAADLDRAIEASQQALAAVPPEDPARGAILANLGAMLRARSERTGRLPDVDQAVEAGERALAAMPPGGANRAGCLSNLGASLVVRYTFAGDSADLDRAIEVGEQALAAAGPDSPDRAAILSNLGAALKIKFARSASAAAGLDRAIEIGEQAVAAMPPAHPGRSTALTNLGIALRARFERTGQLPDLDRAIEAGEKAVTDAPAGHPDRAVFLNNLAIALTARFVRSAAAADGDQAVEVGEQAVDAAPNPASRANCLANLSITLQARFERAGAQSDLDRAIEIAEQAVAAAPPGRADRGRPLAALAGALQEKCRHTGTRADLDRAIEAGEQAVAATSPDSPDYAPMLSNLGIARRTRFERTGALADLDRAIEVSEQAVDAFAADHLRRAACLSNLGGALRVRFGRTGALADLDRAIEITGQALAATPDGHPDRAGILSNLGIDLGSRFERTGAPEDLDRAIEAGEQALAATPADRPEHARRLSNLGADLHSRFERAGAAADLDRAIEVGEQAVAATSPGHPERPGYLTNLGIALRGRFERAGAAADLDRAIEVEELAVAATPLDHPDRAGYLCNLGAALWTRFERTGAAADRERVVELGREGAMASTAPPSDRARAAKLWGDFAAVTGNWDLAVEGYALAVGLLARVAPRSLGRSDQEYWLGELGGLAERAAACCLQADQVDYAVELWEQGRGVLLGQALDIRTDLTRLGDQHPQLAAAFSQLRDELDQLPAAAKVPEPAFDQLAPPGDDDPAGVGQDIDRRRQAADQLDHVIAEIRSRPGFDRFLLPLPIDELLPAGDAGPVVLVNLSDIRSDALVLTPAGVEAIPLPGLAPQEARDRVQALLAALAEVHDPGTDPDHRGQAEQRLSEVLGWLWDAVAGPVLGRLHLTGPPAEGEDWPRLWWCASGLLAFLPLHAAGHHATRFDAAPQTVLDRVTSSYTPTVRALIHSRRPRTELTSAELTSTELTSTERLLVVAMPQTPDVRDLPGAAAEIALLTELFPAETMILTGSQATHDSVARALPGYRWAHFACHAASNPADPSASYLVLSDHRRRPLTVLDLTRLRLEGVELAFLSACSTASVGKLPDEAIQLAAGFQLAGFRHVIATMWPIGDHPAVKIATWVYTDLARQDADAAACALHHATRRLRRLTARQPSIWAAHIHNGA